MKDSRRAGWDMEVLTISGIPGGDRRLVHTVCGEYLLITQVAGRVTDIRLIDQAELAAAAGGTNENDSQNNRERSSAGGAGVPGRSRPSVDGAWL
jgi:hypothetical protein